jgi:hypothetical protein
MGSSCRAATPQFSSSTQFTVGIAGFVSFGFALHAACICSTGTTMVKKLLAPKTGRATHHTVQTNKISKFTNYVVLTYIHNVKVTKESYCLQFPAW